MATRGERGIGRVLDKLEASISKSKKFADLLNLLYKGATLLLQRDQQGSGADLAILLIDVLNKSETKPNEEWIGKAAKLFELMNSSIPERETYLTNSVKWSMSNNKKGHPLLHKKIAEVYWKEKKYSSAHRHFLHSCDGSAYASMLVELHTTKGLKSEIDLFIAQPVLQILCLRNIQMASETFNKYTGLHPTINNHKGPPYLFPLLNFLWFLLRAVEQKRTSQFKILRSWYALSIKRDPNYSVYLDNIGRIWFGIEIPTDNRNSNSLFGGLLKSIIGDMDSSDEEDDRLSRKVAAPELD